MARSSKANSVKCYNCGKFAVILIVVIIGALLSLALIFQSSGIRPPATGTNITTNGTISSPKTTTSNPNTTTSNPTNTTLSNSTVIAENLSEELNNSATAGFTFNSTTFYATSSAQCTVQRIAACYNNDPQQVVCINSNYSASAEAQYNSIHSNGTGYACPDFYMEGSISCGIVNNHCVVMDTRPNLP